MSKRAQLFWYYWEKFGILAILLLALIIFRIMTPSVLSISNLLILLSRSAIVGIPAMGMTYAICSGGFDLSVGSIVGLCTCVWASLLPQIGIVPATAVTLLVGVLCGALNGMVITKLRIQTFVATLAMGMIYNGIAQVYTNGSKQIISRTENIEAKFFSKNVQAFGYQVQLVPILMMLLVFIVGYVIYRYTRFGVHVRSVGSNEPSARTSGIRVDRTLIMVFVTTGVTAASSSLITASQLMQGAATLGVSFELEVITATILGGTSLAGGKGNIWGSLVAALLLALVRNGLNILHQPEESQRLAIGFILLAALAVNGIQELMKEANE